MHFRYFIELQYNGKNYHGWQIQPNAPTVQAEINEKMSILLKLPVETLGAGRTDTGVHARHFMAHFDLPEDISKNLTSLTRKLNLFLPDDINIQRIFPVTPTAHARFDALSRTYKYYISTQKDVFLNDYSWPIFQKLDTGLMQKASQLLMNYDDFTSFSKLHSDNKTNLCHIESAGWSKEENKLIFTIKADRFLRNMVRAIVGTLVLLGRKKITANELEEIIMSKDRSCAGESAPAQGLFLHLIEYP